MMELALHHAHERRHFPGLYSGTVKDVDDATHRGSVKVAVASVFQGESPDFAVWARPCFPWGHVFVPEVGDHVWVAFEDGDPSAPVWLGSWYATGATPSDAAVSPPVKRLIRSKSGHEILLDDSTGQEKVVITDKSGSSIELSTTEMKLHSTLPLTIEAQTVTIKGTTSIVLKSPSVDVTT